MKIRHRGARALARATTILLLTLLWAGTALLSSAAALKAWFKIRAVLPCPAQKWGS